MAQGRALLAAGRHAEAKAAAKRALALAEERGEPPQQAYALKLLGDIESVGNDLNGTEAEMYFQRAFQLAEKCGMRPLMALCNSSLASCRP